MDADAMIKAASKSFPVKNPIHPKLKLRAFLALFSEWVYSWLATNPPKELLQIAHSQLGKLYNRIDKEMKKDGAGGTEGKQKTIATN